MCFHLTTNVQYACGHKYPIRRHYIDCNNIDCRLSRSHTLVSHDCMCQAIMNEDQDIVLDSDVEPVPCDPCLGVGPPPKEYVEPDSESEGSELGSGVATEVEETEDEPDIRSGEGEGQGEMTT